jgi:hypothetical protein
MRNGGLREWLVVVAVASGCSNGALSRSGSPAGGDDALFAGCAKDTDCKGDRICVDGKCMDPSAPTVDAATGGGSCAGAGWIGLANRVDYDTAVDPQALALGDLNGDGHPDIAVSTLFGGLNVLLNNGNGTFAPHLDYGVGKGTAVAIDDLNGDGKPDVAVVNSGGMASLGGSNSVAVFFNRGNGTLDTPVSFDTGMGPRGVAIGDLNGDHRLDLAVVNVADSTVSVLLNQGGGTFAARTDYAAGMMPWSLALGDLDGDGRPDFAVPNYAFGVGAAVSLLLDKGGGGYAAPVALAAGSQPVSVAIGDFNGDSKPDLAVANSAVDTVGVLLNQGGGAFAARVDYGVGSNPDQVEIGDVNGDGLPDLVVVNGNAASVSVLLNHGEGTFPTRMDFGTGQQPSQVAIGDLNGDGKLDLAVVNYNSSSISVLLNLGCH